MRAESPLTAELRVLARDADRRVVYMAGGKVELHPVPILGYAVGSVIRCRSEQDAINELLWRRPR
jgi:hypothetical protein